MTYLPMPNMGHTRSGRSSAKRVPAAA